MIHRFFAWIQEQLLLRKPVVSSMIFAALALPILLMFVGLQAFALRNPDVLALYQADALWGMQLMLMGLIAWLVIVVAYGWHTRLDEPPCTRLPMLTITPTVLAMALLGIGHGLKDTPMSLTILAPFFLGRALFGVRPLIPALVMGILLLLGNEALVALHRLPYAPLLTHPVFEGTELALWWKVWLRVVFTASALPFSIMVFFLFGTLAMRRRELEDLVRTDMLTGLANRRTFMSQLEIESHRHARNKRPFCLIMCDVDHFKKINDTWGHPAGDAVLMELGRILKRTSREQLDTAARIGGEEFAVLMPETSLSQAQMVAEAMSAGVRSSIFVFDGQEVTVTQSVGIAQTNHGDGDAALRLADDNLYQAKRSGRDRIVGSLIEAQSE